MESGDSRLGLSVRIARSQAADLANNAACYFSVANIGRYQLGSGPAERTSETLTGGEAISTIASLHELFATAGDIKVSDSELQIVLAPLSSPHRTRAAHALCDLLDQTATVFPGSHLRVRFAIRPPPCIGLAFPRVSSL